MASPTPAQVAGLNYDKNGKPYLNISARNVMSLNYDFNGKPILGLQVISYQPGNMLLIF